MQKPTESLGSTSAHPETGETGFGGFSARVVDADVAVEEGHTVSSVAQRAPRFGVLSQSSRKLACIPCPPMLGNACEMCGNRGRSFCPNLSQNFGIKDPCFSPTNVHKMNGRKMWVFGVPVSYSGTSTRKVQFSLQNSMGVSSDSR